MTNAVDDVRAMLGDLDPAPPPSAADRAMLDTILASPPVRTVNRRLVLSGVAAAVAVVAVAGVAMNSPPQPAGEKYLATPKLLNYELPADPPAAAAVLERLATASDRAPGPSRTGDHAFTRTDGWRVYQRISAGKPVAFDVKGRTDLWRTADPQGLSAWTESDGDWPADAPDGTYDTFDHRRSEAFGSWLTPPPTTVDALRTYLAANRPDGNPLTADPTAPDSLLLAVADARKSWVLSPAQRSAVLRFLATLPGLRYAGTVTDRAGRSGEAFTLDATSGGHRVRYTLIADPVNGALLGYEQLLLDRVRSIPLRYPAVVAYECYLASDYRPGPRNAQLGRDGKLLTPR